MHQQPRTIDPPGKPKSSSRSLHVCSVSGRTSNMAAVWHSAAHGTRPASVALCGKTNPSHLFQPCICGLVRKDAAVDRICGFVRKGEPPPPIPAPHLWPCAERRGRRPHLWLCAERRTPPTYSSPASVALCGKTRPSTASVALCGKTNPSHLFQPRICGLVRKDAAVDRICGFLRKDEPLPPIPAPHLSPCAERRGRRPHLWLCAERRTPPPYSSPASVALCGKTRPSTASVAFCGKTNPSHLFQPRICRLVRKDAAVDRICGFVRRDEPLPPIPAPHLWPCAERRGRRPHLWLCAERRTPPCPNRPTSVVLCGKTASP